MGQQGLTAGAGPALYAGIDGGGTHSRCVVAGEDGTIRGVGRGGPGSALIAGGEVALASFRAALADARGARSGPVTHLHVAAAGTAVPEGLGELADTYSSGNDTVAAFAGALVRGPGLIVIGGTGSAAYGEDEQGRALVHGGWGPLLDDAGSGYAIGRGALLALTRVYDERRPHDGLTEALARELGVHDRASLLARVHEPPLPRPAIAALSTLVAHMAAAGDRQARKLLREAGGELGELAGSLAMRLGLADTPVRVATIGGVFGAGPALLDRFDEQLRRQAPLARIVLPQFPPPVGALLLAYRAALRPLDEALLARLAASWRATASPY